MSTQARRGFNYFITFTDDYSRFGYVYLMKHKSESFDKFKVFKNEVQNQLGKTIKALRSDRGGEYLTTDFIDHLGECGILSEWTPSGTPQLNGVSERRNRTLLDMVRSIISQTKSSNILLGICTRDSCVHIEPGSYKGSEDNTIQGMEWEASQVVVHEDLGMRSLCQTFNGR